VNYPSADRSTASYEIQLQPQPQQTSVGVIDTAQYVTTLLCSFLQHFWLHQSR